MNFLNKKTKKVFNISIFLFIFVCKSIRYKVKLDYEERN
jgi:hypothetical protein